MRCPHCLKYGGQRSTVRFCESSSTLMFRDQFWDEDGNFHSHDPNLITETYQCSNGHTFHESRGHACPHYACDFGKAP